MKNKKYTIKCIEIEAKTVKQAIKEALKKLDATEQEVSIQVIKEEQRGLFGMQGVEAARVRVTLESKTTPNETPQSKNQDNPA